jgi:hypothetical protein
MDGICRNSIGVNREARTIAVMHKDRRGTSEYIVRVLYGTLDLLFRR